MIPSNYKATIASLVVYLTLNIAYAMETKGKTVSSPIDPKKRKTESITHQATSPKGPIDPKKKCAELVSGEPGWFKTNIPEEGFQNFNFSLTNLSFQQIDRHFYKSNRNESPQQITLKKVTHKLMNDYFLKLLDSHTIKFDEVTLTEDYCESEFQRIKTDLLNEFNELISDNENYLLKLCKELLLENFGLVKFDSSSIFNKALKPKDEIFEMFYKHWSFDSLTFETFMSGIIPNNTRENALGKIIYDYFALPYFKTYVGLAEKLSDQDRAKFYSVERFCEEIGYKEIEKNGIV